MHSPYQELLQRVIALERIVLRVKNTQDEFGDDLDLLESTVLNLINQESTDMATLQQILDKVTEEDTAIDSLIALNAGLKQQITDALSGVTLPPAVQSQIDAVFAGVSAEADKVTAALAANVSVPTPTPTPSTDPNTPPATGG